MSEGIKKSFSLVATYIVVAWGIVQFLDWICKRYELNSIWTDAFGLAAILFLPSFFLFNWLHSDTSRLFKRSKLFYTSNLIIVLLAVGALISSGYSKSTTEKVILTDENGVEKALEISKRDYIRQIIFLPFESDQDQQWLSLAVPTLMANSIHQSKRFNTEAPLDIIPRIKELGYKIGESLPQNIQRTLLSKRLADYAVMGTIKTLEADNFEYELTLISSKKSEVLLRKSGMGKNIYQLADSLTTYIYDYIFKKDLGIPLESYQLVPINEIYSPNKDAFELYFKGTLTFTQLKYGESIPQFDQALSLDNKFVEAYYFRGYAHYLNQSLNRGMEDLVTAMKFANSVTDFQQLKIKMLYYSLQMEYDKQKALLQMWVKRHPESSFAFKQLMNLEFGHRNIEQAIEVAKQAEVLGHDKFFLFDLAKLYARNKDMEGVEEYIKKYEAAFPDDQEFQKKMGDIFIRQGDYAQALEHFTEYKALNPLDAIVNINLANCNYSLGNFDAVERALEEGLEIAESHNDSFLLFGELESYFEQRGQIVKSIETMNQRVDFSEPHRPRLTTLSYRASTYSMNRHLLIGEDEKVEKYINEFLIALDGDSPKYIISSWLNYYYIKEEAAGFNKYFEQYKTDIVSSLSSEMFQALDGYSKKFSGDYAEAISILEKVVENSSDGGAEYHLYDAYRLIQDYEKAANGFESLLKMSPFNGLFLLRYAQCLAGLEKLDETTKVITKLERIWENADENYLYYQQFLDFKKSLNLLN